MDGIWLASYVALWLVVLFEGSLVFVLFRELGVRMLHTSSATARDGLPLGTTAPVFGDRSPRAGVLTMLVFGSPQCAPCRELVPQLNQFAARHVKSADVFFITPETADGAAVTARELAATIPGLGDRTAAERYQVRVTPFVYVLDEAGVVVSKGLASHGAALNWVWSEGVKQFKHPQPAPLGREAHHPGKEELSV